MRPDPSSAALRHSFRAQPQVCRKCSGECISRRSCSWGAGARAAPKPPCVDVLTARNPARCCLAAQSTWKGHAHPFTQRCHRRCRQQVATSPQESVTAELTVHMHACMAHEGRKAAGIQSCSHCVCSTLLQSAAAPMLQVTPSKCKKKNCQTPWGPAALILPRPHAGQCM